MVHVPFERLPSSPAAQHAALRDYFCDKDAQAVRSEDGWTLALGWPDGEDRHVDPRLQQGLDWWGDNVARPTMALMHRRAGRILTALYDTWTVHSWSQWLARRAASAGDHIVILHVDDHRDLASPRLFMAEDGFFDALTGARVELSNPNSVRSAILSGALGMGSFLTPFLHTAPTTEVRHLCQPPKATSTVDYRVVLTTEPDTLLQPGTPRPAVKLEPQSGATGPGCYRTTPDVQAWLAGVGAGPILLHIDMDYFNNRYDGDSNWADRENAFDPALDVVLAKIDEMTKALRESGVGLRIEDIVIAYSPGFFPAEFWGIADDRLRQGIKTLHDY